jgi:parallel beta-helix repeat protein
MKQVSYPALFLFTALTLCAYGANYNCDSCSDCSAKIQSAAYGDTVYLSGDAPGQDLACVVFAGKSGVSFDCQGHNLTCNSSLPATIAVRFWSGGGNSVRNCNLVNYKYGIYVNRSSGNIFEDNIISSDAFCGIRIIFSDNNSVRDNTIIGLSGTSIGINLSSSKNNSFIGNNVSARGTGISMDAGSENNALYNNRVCLPVYSTGIVIQNGLNYGDNNFCDGTYRYNDACVTGCKYDCSVSITTTTTTSSTTTTQAQCALSGDLPPCGVVSLFEVVDLINLWAEGSSALQEVVNLINAWAGPQ